MLIMILPPFFDSRPVRGQYLASVALRRRHRVILWIQRDTSHDRDLWM
jgi:hypothetical protein